MTNPAYEVVDFHDALRDAIATAGGDEAFAKQAGVSLIAVWQARDDREPHHSILVALGLTQVMTTFRRKP